MPKITHTDGFEADFAEEFRCQARSRQNDRRCQRRAVHGIRVCTFHGGGSAEAKAKSERIKAMTAMKRFVTPIDAGDIEANPIAAFELEFRRTVARIRYFDAVLEQLDPENLGWGMTKETEVNSSEYPGVDKESTAAANIYYELQSKERKHLLDMIKIWIGAKLDVRKLEIEEQKVDALNGVLDKVLTALGHDTTKPEVRRLVRDSMLELPVAGQPIVATAMDIINSTKPLKRQKPPKEV